MHTHVDEVRCASIPSEVSILKYHFCNKHGASPQGPHFEGSVTCLLAEEALAEPHQDQRSKFASLNLAKRPSACICVHTFAAHIAWYCAGSACNPVLEIWLVFLKRGTLAEVRDTQGWELSASNAAPFNPRELVEG